MISLLISIIIVGVIVWLLLYVIDYVGLPEPFNKVAKVVIILIAVLWMISVLLPLIGTGSTVKPLNLN